MDNNDMFRLSLILGVIQILFGMVLKAVNQTIQFGFKYAIATIGWIILLVSTAVSALFSSSELLSMGGTAYKVVLCISGAMIFLFNTPGKNIFMNIGLGLWDSYNIIIRSSFCPWTFRRYSGGSIQQSGGRYESG